MTERQFQAAVVDAARAFGWCVYHTFDSRRSAPGFPDLVACRDRVMFVELKTEAGRLSQAQSEWIHALGLAGAHVHVWRPSDWDALVEVLR